MKIRHEEACEGALYDAEECFDSLWSEDCTNELFNAGCDNENLAQMCPLENTEQKWDFC